MPLTSASGGYFWGVTMTKRRSKECRNPFLAHPFEAFSNGSWCNVEHLRIADGKITTCFEGHGSITEQNVPVANLRIRPRKANPFDCTCFLRPGINVCVLLSDPTETDACQDSPQLAWIDAKINSIERKPHVFGCSCRFYVSLNNHPSRMETKMIKGEIREVMIDDIAILQQLERKPCEDGYFRWISSMNCTSISEVKLFRGQFMYDASWLLVTSALKGVEFKICSMQNKILYRVLDGDTNMGCFGADKIVKAINFKVEDDGVLRPNIITFPPDVPTEISVPNGAINTAPLIEIEDDAFGYLPPYDPISLRRSKRRNAQPERFVGDAFLKGKSWVSKTERKRKSEEAESSSVILCNSDSDCSVHSNCSEHTSMNDSDGKIIETSSNTLLRKETLQAENHKRTKTTAACKRPTEKKAKSAQVQQSSFDSDEKIVETSSKTRLREETLQAENHKRTETTTACKRPIEKKAKSAEVQQSGYDSKQTNKRIKSLVTLYCVTSRPKTSSDDPVHAAREDAVIDKQNHVENHTEKVTRVAYKRTRSGSEKKKKKKKSTSRKKNKRVEKKVKKMGLGKECRSKCSLHSRRKMYHRVGAYKTTLNKREYKEVIERCMKNIDSEILKHQEPAVHQWEEILSYQWWKLPQPPPSNEPVENPELEDLWKEMQMSMHSFQFLDANPTDVVGAVNKSSTDDVKPCRHEYILDEQIGSICRFCRSVDAEIRYILPPFAERTARIRCVEDYFSPADDFEWKLLDKASIPGDTSIHEKNETVWALIPNLQNKLHTHQKKAFEFLWKNIAGSLLPADMDGSLERTGGCVISHAPGAGKTLLVISFLVSYLKLFPRKRPLILAPKTTLHTWYKEFEKWEVSIPVYQIHARKNYRKEQQNKTARASTGKFKLNQDIMHAMDCLKKFEKWHEHASVLLMSYPSFLSILRGNSVFEHWRYMAGILRQSPSLLIFDEGHNPRSTKSMMRKTLMQVKTEHRILLSGTLFQNTFEEYFNTLCLARPAFISEVLRALDPISRRNRYRQGLNRNEKEKRARRFFVEEVANRINSKVDEERMKGLKILKKITSGFIDVYEGGGTSHKLPGLRSYKLLIKPTVMQQECLSMIRKNSSGTRYPLELELLITFVSIHPWLITSLRYSKKYYSEDVLKELEKYKLDLNKGSKVRFVVSLVWKCISKKEKVLIFCRNIPPIRLFVEIFEKIFGWTKGDQVLELIGEQHLWERSRVIEKFEEPGGSSQVLLASITACSEGISLTAASRVVLLDCEWNPSKRTQAVGRAFRPGQERMVYVYQLLASGTMDEDKHGRNIWKERVSKLISVGAGNEDPSCRQPEDVDDEVLKEIIREDRGQSVQVITKDEQLTGRSEVGKEAAMLSLVTL